MKRVGFSILVAWVAVAMLGLHSCRHSEAYVKERIAQAQKAHSSNQPTEAVDICRELLTHRDEMSMSTYFEVCLMLCDNLSALGLNKEAAEALGLYVIPYRRYMSRTLEAEFATRLSIYQALAPYEVNVVEAFGDDALIYFSYEKIGESAQLMMLEGVEVKGQRSKALFDTGAGVNVISETLAKEYGLKVFPFRLTAAGYGVQRARLGIAERLQVGEVTLRNVPFFVMTMRSGHAQADQYMKQLGLILGRPFMEALRYLTIDFVKGELRVSNQSPVSVTAESNLSLNASGNYLLKCSYNGKSLLAIPDTGDASYGAFSDADYEAFRHLLPEDAAPDTMRVAGMGGWEQDLCYYLQDIPLTIGDTTVVVPKIPLLVDEASARIGSLLGLQTLRMYRVLAIDLERMAVEPRP